MPATTQPAAPLTHDRLHWDVEELTNAGGLLDQLNALLPVPTSTLDNSPLRHIKTFGAPAPWHPEAGNILMAIHAGARDLENEMRYRLNGTTAKRGGSEVNTRKALASVVRLAYALPAPVVEDAANQVAGWVRAARQIHDIDQTDRWVPLPRAPGMMPPPCPYCDTYALRMSRRAGEVRCINPECVDDRGRRPVARMAYGHLTGDAYLAFGDGREVVYE